VFQKFRVASRGGTASHSGLSFSAERADATNPQHVAVPFAGVVHALVAQHDTVEAGQAVAVVEAMKMEASITAHRAGTVGRLVIGDARQAEGGDLLLVLD
jgi:pyruvate carboxylase